MALVKYGAGIVQMSGSIAGDVHARNRFGNYKRPRTKPVNPKSPRQVAARVIMMYLAEQWREAPMTDVERIAWQTYADSVNWNNRLGEQVTLTGFNMFIRGNASRLCCGGELITDGPIDLGLPPGDPQFCCSYTASTQKIAVTFDDGFDWLGETGGFLSVEMGLPQSPSRNFFGGPWRFADSIEGDDTTPPTTPADIDPPFTLIEGQKVWCRAAIIRADGRMSTRFRCGPNIVAT